MIPILRGDTLTGMYINNGYHLLIMASKLESLRGELEKEKMAFAAETLRKARETVTALYEGKIELLGYKIMEKTY